MYCRRCGRANRADAAFCDACGVRLDGSADRALIPPILSDTAAHSTPLSPPKDHPAAAYHMSEGIFVGRQREMASLHAALENALSNRGRLVMLAGEPGIGKTRTAQELAIHAAGLGAQVLWGRCYETSGAPPFWPWVQIIRTYIRGRDAGALRAQMEAGAADIAEIVPALREQLPDILSAPPVADSEQARFRLFDSVTTFLRRAAQQEALLLILDNLHWADRASLLLLEFLAREIGESRILVVGTYRDLELSRQHPLFETLGELTRERLLQRLPLRGLSQEEVAHFIAVTTRMSPSRQLVEAVHEQTEGNPLFLTEVVWLLVEEGGLASDHQRQRPNPSLGIPQGVREVIGRRLNRLSPGCNEVLGVASVIGREFGLEELRRVLDDTPAEQLLERLEEAVTARVIEGLPQAVGCYQFTHVLIQQTLYDELAVPRRAWLHRRIGEVLEALHRADPEPCLTQLAYHFAEAAESGTLDKAIEYAERAGARASALLAYEEAVHHYEKALQLLESKPSGDAAKRCTLLLVLGEAQRKAGEFLAAMETFQRVASLAKKRSSPEDQARAALGFEDTSWRAGLGGDAAIRLLNEALEAQQEGDTGLKARLHGGLSRMLAFTGAFERAAATSQQAVEMARRIGDRSTLAFTLRTRIYALHAPVRPGNISERLAAATEAISLAKQAGDKALVLEAYTGNLLGLMERGDISALDSQLAAQTRLAEELRLPFYLYMGMAFRAMLAIFEGRFEDGEQLAQQALALGQRLRAQNALGVFGVQMLTLRREQGRLQELAPAVRSFVQMHPAASTWRPGLALIYSELGLEPEARAEFEALAANDFADIPQDALWPVCVAYLSEVCAFLRDGRRAATLYHFLLPYDGRNIVVGPVTACYGSVSRYLGLLAATMRQWEKAQRHFEDALAMNASMGAKPWLAHTQLQYAEMLLARGQSGDVGKALALLDEALAIARELGMHALAEQAVSLQQQARFQSGRTRTYPCSLTPREVEVLRFIAAGKSNRDIAAALCISLKTVANHVHSILAKIEAANRTEAAAFAIRHGLSPLSPDASP